MSGCAESTIAVQIQAISAGRYGQNCPWHCPQAKAESRFTRRKTTGRDRSLPITRTKDQLYEREKT